jgi:hypothetical protein
MASSKNQISILGSKKQRRIGKEKERKFSLNHNNRNNEESHEYDMEASSKESIILESKIEESGEEDNIIPESHIEEGFEDGIIIEANIEESFEKDNIIIEERNKCPMEVGKIEPETNKELLMREMESEKNSVWEDKHTLHYFGPKEKAERLIMEFYYYDQSEALNAQMVSYVNNYLDSATDSDSEKSNNEE